MEDKEVITFEQFIESEINPIRKQVGMCKISAEDIEKCKDILKSFNTKSIPLYNHGIITN